MKNLSREFEKLKVGLSYESVLLLSWLLVPLFLAPLKFVLHRVGIDSGVGRECAQLLLTSIPLLLFFAIYPKDKLKEFRPVFFVWLFVYVTVAISYYASPEIRYFLFRSDYGLTRSIRPDAAMYALLFFMLVRDSKELLRDLRIYAYFKFLYLFVFEIIPFIRDGGWTDIGARGQEVAFSYNLGFGYAMLLVTVILFYSFIVKGYKTDFVLGCFGFYEVFNNGNRGALLLLCGFVFLFTLQRVYFYKDKKYGKYMIGGLFIFSALFALTKDPIAVLGVVVLNKMNPKPGSYNIGKNLFVVLSVVVCLLLVKQLCLVASELLFHLDTSVTVSRNQMMLSSGEFTSGNGREDIWASVFNAFKANPITGYGFYGDRPFVYPHHAIAYSHNVLLELVCSYGILGLLAFIYIVKDAYYMLFKCEDQRWREIYLIFFVVAAQLLISYSFWYVFEIWAAAAISYCYRRFIILSK